MKTRTCTTRSSTTMTLVESRCGRLADSVARLQRAVDEGDQTLFVDAMLAGREFLVASDRRRDRAD